ncbi:MAG: amino acid permease [Betaproteobacteria bacterium]|nr:amino acid permease [Betaproteobacteria bacterium]
MDSNQKVVNAAPRQLLSVFDGVFLMAGMVIGVGIFKAPSVVAGSVASGAEFLLAWLFGGVISLAGALVYAELSARHPETGGEYAFLSRGLGRATGFLFAWSRISVIQTGAIAAVAFVFGDYAAQILSLGAHGPAIYAALGVIALTLLNLAGTLRSKNLQKVMETLLVLGLICVAVGGIMVAGPSRPVAAAAASGGGAYGLAMIFVLLTYGGWNEAAYLAGEVREPKKNMTRILVWGILAVTALYMLVNIGYLAALGLQGMKDSKAVAADVMRLIAGERGAIILAIIVCVSAFTTMNAAIFTGARTSYAFGRDFALFAGLGRWREAGSTPATALIWQGVVTLLLIGASAFTPDGFSAMVAYTSPVFWTFFLLTGITLFVFRARDAGGEPPLFRVPGYPVVPLAFCAMCVYMLYSSIDFIRGPYGPSFGIAVLGGIAVMTAGLPLYFISRGRK